MSRLSGKESSFATNIGFMEMLPEQEPPKNPGKSVSRRRCAAEGHRAKPSSNIHAVL